MIKAVIVDLDDTLCLTEAACFDLENAALQAMGRPRMSREIHLQTWGRPLFEAIFDRSPGVNLADFKAAYHPLVEQFVSGGKLDVIPEANYRALDQLIASGKEIMVLTTRTHAMLEHMLEPSHQLFSRIKAFYYEDNTKFHKPDPRAFEQLLADNNLLPAECVYVGDSLGDAAATAGAGMHFIASLESGLRERDDFAPGQVAAFIQSFPEVVGVVAALESA